MENYIYFIILWTGCGSVNVGCVYLAEVVYKRPDYADEYKFLSLRNVIVFIAGGILTGVVWVLPTIAYQNLQIYNGK